MRRKKEEILDDLVSNIREMIEILRRGEPAGQWTRAFEGFLASALDLQSSGYPEQGIREFCGGIRSVFGGMGSFNDYSPSPEIPGAEKFESLSHRVYALADEIRIVG